MNAVWIKGGRIKQAAYLIINEKLVTAAKKMLIAEINEGGYFKVAIVDPILIVREALELERETVGFLSYANIQLGNRDEIWCPQDSYQKITVDTCRGASFDERCYSWDGSRCVFPNLTRRTKAQLQSEREGMKA